MGGGTSISITGKYTTVKNNVRSLYLLKGAKLLSHLFLVKMDARILHFADSSERLMVGNPGYSYMLSSETNN